LVIARLAFPLSKLKTVDYLRRYQGKEIEIDTVYRFLDKLSGRLNPHFTGAKLKNKKQHCLK